jgi:hypothetical protein
MNHYPPDPTIWAVLMLACLGVGVVWLAETLIGWLR